MWNWARVGLAGLATVTVAVTGLPAYLKRRFRPAERAIACTPADLGLRGDQVWLTGRSGKKLHGWFIPAIGAAPGVVVLHGWGANAALMLPFAPYLQEIGHHALFLDARNHGLSEPDDYSSMPRFSEDLDVALDWLGGHPLVTRLAVVGHSVGAGAAILSASERTDVEALVLISAFCDPRRIMQEQTTIGRLPGPVRRLVFWTIEKMIGYGLDDIAPRRRIAGVKAPVLFVHGAGDPVVPVNDAVELAGLAPHGRTLILPEADHSDPNLFQPCIPDVMAFLSAWLGTAGAGPPGPPSTSWLPGGYPAGT